MQDKAKLKCSLSIGILLIISNIWKFDYHLIINLWHTNLALITKPNEWLQLVTTSFQSFSQNSIYSGLLGLSGVYFILTGFIYKPNNRIYTTPECVTTPLPPVYTGIIFGQNTNNQPFTIEHKELNQHALVIGTTGSGKTSTLMNIVYNCCEQNLPLIYVDGKGSIKLANKISEICNKFGRKLKIFSIDSSQNIAELSKYNPLAYGNFTEWKNKISTLLGEAESKGQEHYAIQEQSYINLVCEILNKSKRYIDFEALLGYLSHPEELQKLANAQGPEIAKRLLKVSAEIENNDIIKTLELFYYSHYGSLFSTSGAPEESIINLQHSIMNNEIVLFLFDAASYKRDTSLLGKLVINDINSAFSGFGRSGVKVQAYCIFDEFAAYASANMANVLAMQRDNGMHAIIGTQSIHAISEESQQIKRIAVELIANCNTFIIHKINDALDIDLLQKTIGKEIVHKLHNINSQLDRAPSITTTMVEEYILDGAKIRALTPGFGYVCQTVNWQKPKLIKFNFI